MHFRLPKPLHGWREFAGEVGIIVVGVLIALGAEQVVETVHYNREADEARAALRSEVAEDDLPQAYVRLAIAPCIDAQLKRLQSAVDEHMDRGELAPLIRKYRPPGRTWDSEAWKAVLATGVLAHAGAGELINWSLPYRAITALGPANASELDDMEQLHSISTLPGQLTPAELDRVTVALEHLRYDEERMLTLSEVFVAAAKKAGVELNQQQREHTLEEIRPEWGKCMTVPLLRDIDIQTQNERSLKR